jgi:hypothetical protein
MSHRPLFFVGLMAGATLLPLALPPAHAESSRDNSSRLRGESHASARPSPSSSGSTRPGHLFGSSSGRSDSRSGSSFVNSPSRGGFSGGRTSPGTFDNRGSFSRRGDSSPNVFQRTRPDSSPLNTQESVPSVNRFGGADASRPDRYSRHDSGTPGYTRTGPSFNRAPGSPFGQRNPDPAPQSSLDRRDSGREDNLGSALGRRTSPSVSRNSDPSPERFRRNTPGQRSERRNPFFNDDGVTNAGRVLGTNRPLDSEGRTAVGRALGSPIDRAGVHYRRAPQYGYNPRNGRYESFDHSRSRWSISVLFGTAAAYPTYRFRYHSNHYGLYYYPYYCTDTFGLSVGSYYQSPYFYFGSLLPLYIPSTRVVVVDRPVIVHDDDYSSDDADSYYLNRPVEQDVDSALAEIRRAWVTDDIDLLLKHVRSDQDINVYLKGKYTYSLPAEDYRDLTQDAMKNTETTSFRWLSVDRRSDDEVFVRGEHTFNDSDGEKRTVYTTFTLVQENGAWWIAEVGTSNTDE